MPFKSKAQQKYLFAKDPVVAKRFAKETPKSAYKSMPDYAKKKKKRGRFTELAAKLGK
jgi:hypothetical protein